MLFHFSLEIFNQNVIYKYYLIFMLQCFFLLDTQIHIHAYRGIYIYIYTVLNLLICIMKSYNCCKRSKQFLLHQKRLNLQTMMITIKFNDREKINISNMMLEWQNPFAVCHYIILQSFRISLFCENAIKKMNAVCF